MRVRKILDWLEITRTGTLINPHEFIPSGNGWRIEEVLKPVTYYPHVLRCANGAIVMRASEERQGMRIILSGQPLANIRMRGMSDTELIQFANTDGRKPTRVDFAIDVLGDESVRVSDCIDALHAGMVKCRVRSALEMKDHLKDGQTLYLGSSKSGRQMRIYDKRSESTNMLMQAWTRVELQTRKRYAQALAQDMMRYSVVEAGSAACRAFADFETLHWYQHATATDTPIDLTPVGRKETNWSKWIRESVYPSLESKASTSQRDTVEWLHDQLSELLGKSCT